MLWRIGNYYKSTIIPIACSATISCGESEVNRIIERRKRRNVRKRRNINVAPRHAVANTGIIRNPTSIPVFVAPQNLVAISSSED